MSLGEQIFVVVTCYLLSFVYIRWFLWGVKEYPLNTSARKKRKRGQSFKEWFLYSRYREEIPAILLFLYFTIVLIHPFILGLCLVCNFIWPLPEVGPTLATGLAWFDAGWVLIYFLLFSSTKKEIPYERWLSKQRKNKKKK